jgi:CxxC-x17-CxxC domain-containing protein
MNNFKPGGQRNRKEFLGGRPKSDADYGNKKRFDSKPRFESHGRRDEGRGGSSYNDRGPKEVQLFSATCTTCGKSCEVPFRPDGTKPVLCRDCFAAKNASPMAEGRNYSDRPDTRSNERPQFTPRPTSAPAVPSVEIAALTKQVSSLQSKVDEILSLLKSQKTAPVAKETPVVAKEVVITKEVVVAKKVAAPKKVAAKKVAAKPAVKKAVKKAAKKAAPKKK